MKTSLADLIERRVDETVGRVLKMGKEWSDGYAHRGQGAKGRIIGIEKTSMARSITKRSDRIMWRLNRL